MKKGRILLFAWLLVNLSLFVYAEPPIEVIYWKASDVQMPSQDNIDLIRDTMIEVQLFFASEMDRYGFGKKTFTFNSEVKVIKGTLRRHQYTTPMSFVSDTPLMERGFDNQIYAVFLGGGGDMPFLSYGISKQICGTTGGKSIDCNNFVGVPARHDRLLEVLVAHEIGHALGLDHTDELWLNDNINLMHHPLAHFGGGIIMSVNRDYALSQRDATFLNNGGRLVIQDSEDMEDQKIILDTDVNDDGYTDLYDCLIVRSGISIESNYDTDINNDGVTNILDLMLVKASAFEAIAAAAPSRRKVITTTWGELKKRK